jgi:hypothetical protein
VVVVVLDGDFDGSLLGLFEGDLDGLLQGDWDGEVLGIFDSDFDGDLRGSCRGIGIKTS